MNRFLIGAAGLCFLIGTTFVDAQTVRSEYRISDTIKVGGEGFWDYVSVDDSTGRVFASHGTMVSVIDPSAKKVIGTIPDTKGVHGIAIANDLNRGYTSNGQDSSVTVFNLQSLAVITKVSITGKNPDAILYDPSSHNVFTFNGKSSNASVIETKGNKQIATIPLDGKPEFAATDAKGMVYVNIEDKNEISVIDVKTLKVVKTWPIAPGEGPSGLTIDAVNHRLFTVCHNKLMMVLDAESGKVITSLPIGERVDGVAYDPSSKRAFSSNGDGTVTVVQEISKNSFTVLENVATQKGARTIAVNTKTHHLYLPTAEFNPAPIGTKENPSPRPTVKPGSFVVLDIAPAK
jgi:YVTN family beta-propeller protein